MAEVPSRLFGVIANAIGSEMYRERAESGDVDTALVELSEDEREVVGRITHRVIADMAEYLGTENAASEAREAEATDWPGPTSA